MTVDGIGTNSVFSVTSIGSSRAAAELQDRRNRREGAAGSATDDPRAAFDTELQSMLGDTVSISSVNRPEVNRPNTDRTESSRPEGQQSENQSDTYQRLQSALPATYNAAGRLNQTTKPTAAQAPVVSGVVSGGANALASQPTTVPAGADSTESADASEGKAEAAKAPGELSKAEEEQVQKLQQRDAEVRTHEQAHQATGGEHAGGASYSYQRGPDNRQYAVGGSVPIDVSPVADDPEATVQKAEKVRAAAMAPATPSGQDQQVAAKASQMASKARAEQAEEQMNPEKADDKDGLKVKSTTDKNSDDSRTDTATDDAQKAAAAGITGLATGLASQEVRSSHERSSTAKAGDIDEATTATKLGVGAQSASQPATVAASSHSLRPSETVEAMAQSRESDSSRSASLSPAAQATRAAFAAMGSLDTLQHANGTEVTRSSEAPSARTVNRANAAYSRVRGETGLAPAGSGISMAV